MSFWSDAGNFISRNFQSAVKDVGNVVKTVLPTALGMIPGVGQFLSPIASNLMGGGMGGGDSSQQIQQVDYSGNINQLAQQNQQLAKNQQDIAMSLKNLQPQNNSNVPKNDFLTVLKKYGGYIAIPFVALAMYLFMKPKTNKR